jgi:hypothetical protein
VSCRCTNAGAGEAGCDLDLAREGYGIISALPAYVEDRQAGGAKSCVDEGIPSLAIRTVVGGVVELDDEARADIDPVAEYKVNALLGDPAVVRLPVAGSLSEQHEVRQPHLGEDVPPIRCGHQQGGEEVAFGLSQ